MQISQWQSVQHTLLTEVGMVGLASQGNSIVAQQISPPPSTDKPPPPGTKLVQLREALVDLVGWIQLHCPLH